MKNFNFIFKEKMSFQTAKEAVPSEEKMLKGRSYPFSRSVFLNRSFVWLGEKKGRAFLLVQKAPPRQPHGHAGKKLAWRGVRSKGGRGEEAEMRSLAAELARATA